MKGSVSRVGGGHHAGGGGGAPTDLLVCFPSRAHLALMPKPICSPSRPAERHHPSRRSSSRSSRSRGHGGSPLFRSRTKQHMSSSDVIDDEPTSPKVTCAGQIKVRPKPRPGKDWISVVEEIERLHHNKKSKKPSWLEALGIKKDAMQLLGGALRGLRFNMGCFGAASMDCTTDEEDEDEEEEVLEEKESDGSSGAIFSKWFMVLEENQGHESKKQEEEEEEEEVESSASVPPPNALLLMRCRSAPAKGWLQEGVGEDGGVGWEDEISAKRRREEEKEKEKERLVLMSYAPDFFKVSTDIAKETWVVGAMDPLSRCRSWKR